MELIIGSLGFVAVGAILIDLGIRVQDRLAIVTLNSFLRPIAATK